MPRVGVQTYLLPIPVPPARHETVASYLARLANQPQPGCPRCDARHDGGPVTRLLPHHRYVCTRHRYWIGPPDAGQPAIPLSPELGGIIQAQRRHQRPTHPGVRGPRRRQ